MRKNERSKTDWPDSYNATAWTQMDSICMDSYQAKNLSIHKDLTTKKLTESNYSKSPKTKLLKYCMKTQGKISI